MARGAYGVNARRTGAHLAHAGCSARGSWSSSARTCTSVSAPGGICTRRVHLVRQTECRGCGGHPSHPGLARPSKQVVHKSGRPDGKDGSSVPEARSERGRVPGRSSRSAGLPTRSVAAQLQVHRSAGHATVGGTRERVRSGACPRGVAGAGRGVAPGRLGRVELAFEASGRVTSPTEVWERRRKSGRLPTPTCVSRWE